MTSSKIGIDRETGQTVYLPKSARTQGLYIIGIQGTGKSGLIENLILQDIDQQIGVCVLDPHGTLVDNVIARLPGQKEEDKVILLDLADYEQPFGLNLFECSDPTDDGEIIKTLYQVLHVFEKAYDIVPTTPLMYDLLYNIAYTLIANPGYSMIDIRLLLTNEACRKKLVQNVLNTDVQDFWAIWDDPKQTSQSKQEEKRSTILNKMNDFLHVPLRNIIGQSRSTTNQTHPTHGGKILLVKLSRRLEQPSNLIGSILIAQLLNVAYARPAQKRKQFHLYADEFQNFATEAQHTLCVGCVWLVFDTTIAHQNRSQLNSANSQLETNLKDRSRSVGNLAVFKINSKDAEDLAGEFQAKPQPAEIRREPILTRSTDPIDYLCSGGKGHPNPKVSKFVRETLVPFYREVQHPTDSYRGYDFQRKMESRQKTVNSLNKMLGGSYADLAVFELIPQLPLQVLHDLLDCSGRLKEFKHAMKYLQDKVREAEEQRVNIHSLTYDLDKRDGEIWLRCPSPQYPTISPAFRFDVGSHWEKYYENKLQQYEKDEPDFETEEQIQEWLTERKRLRFIGSRLYEEATNFEAFLLEVYEVFIALFHEPILVPSGRYEEKPMSPEPIANAQLRIAQEFVNLPSYTAMVKVIGADNRPVEHTIQTIAPAKGLRGTALQERAVRIQEQNRQQGYIRDRATVRAEITMRQAQSSQQVLQPLQQPQQFQSQPQQPPATRKGKVCQQCGTPNRQEAKFCDNCGASLLAPGEKAVIDVPAPARKQPISPSTPPPRSATANPNPTLLKLEQDTPAPARPTAEIFELTDENFKNYVLEEKSMLVLVVFWSHWNAECKAVLAIAKDLEEKYKGKMKIGKLNANIYPNIVWQYLNPERTLATVFYKDGQITQRVIGNYPKDVFKKVIEYLL